MTNIDLKTISYHEWPDRPLQWSFEGLELGPVNLLVGKNSTGKTRVLNVISGLANTLMQDHLRVSHGNYDMTFSVDGTALRYVLKHDNTTVQEEQVYLNGELKLDRNKNLLKLFYEKENKFIEHEPSANEVSAAARKDKHQHSFLILLHDWAKSVRYYKFSEKLGQEAFGMGIKRQLSENEKPEFNDSDPERVVGIFLRAKADYGQPFADALVADMKELGFPITMVDAAAPEGITLTLQDAAAQAMPFPAELRAIGVKEDGVGGILSQEKLSRGMFRTLSVLIQVNYSQLSQRAHCVIIDDIGEGLDFERSSLLIELLRRKAKASRFQLIMSTNDKFVMNKVPLEEWSILQRHGNKVSVINIHNSKSIFDDFRYIGLSNFAFFEMDFVNGAPSEDRNLTLEGVHANE